MVQRAPSLLNPLIGLIADKISVRYFVIIAPSITAISMSLLGLAPSYSVLVVLLLIMGVSATLFHVPAPVMMRRVSGDRVGMGMSFFMFAGEFARSIGPLIILGAVALWGLEKTYFLIPFGLACSLVLFLRLRNIKISDEFITEKKSGSAFLSLKASMLTLAVLSAFIVSRSFLRGALTIFLPIFLSEKGASIWVAGASLSAIQLTGAAGTIFSGTISDKLGRRNTLLITAIVSPVLMWLFMMVEGILLFPLLLVSGLFLLAPMPVMLATVNELKSEHPAFINGIYMMLSFFLNSMGIMLIGVMGDKIGLETTYYIAAGISLFAIPAVFGLKQKS